MNSILKSKSSLRAAVLVGSIAALLFPASNPHFLALRSVPMALSGASRRKQIPSSSVHGHPERFCRGLRGGGRVSRRMGEAARSRAEGKAKAWKIRLLVRISEIVDQAETAMAEGLR